MTGFLMFALKHWRAIAAVMALGVAFGCGWNAHARVTEKKEMAVEIRNEKARADVAEKRLGIANGPDASVDAVADWLSGGRAD